MWATRLALSDMGNREDLLAGATKCLVELGYARTTARDISTAAGTSLAAIGYHFGSKNKLMSEALIELLDASFVEQFANALQAAPQGADRHKQFMVAWSKIIAGLAHSQGMLIASVENLAQVVRLPEVRAALISRQQDAVETVARNFLARNPGVSTAQAEAVGRLYLVLFQGLAICWLAEPELAPTAEQLADAMVALTEPEVAG